MNEWRLAVGPKSYVDKAFNFRPGKSMLIPYYALKVAEGSWANKIDEIVVGPCPHPELSRNAVGGLLIRYGATANRGYPKIRSSSIPYRSW
jgi:hypothetical protein